MFENTFFYIAYAGDSTVFKKRWKVSQGTTEYNQLLIIFYAFGTKSI